MTKRMLIDDTRPEETRVVIVNGNKVEDVEFESASRKQIKGNIYLAKVMRVEPSLQAAFVDYGGNKHGFLAFGEIHPDYYNVSEEELASIDKEVDEDYRSQKNRRLKNGKPSAKDTAPKSSPIRRPAKKSAKPVKPRKPKRQKQPKTARNFNSGSGRGRNGRKNSGSRNNFRTERIFAGSRGNDSRKRHSDGRNTDRNGSAGRNGGRIHTSIPARKEF